VSTITFGDHVTPPLGAGDYTVTVTQTLTIGTPTEGYRAVQDLTVLGPRYALAPGTVGTLFPPTGSQGDFANVLPHVVLSEPSLPWQRSPGGSIPGPPPSWLAVLVFDAADPPPRPFAIPQAQLAGGAPVFAPPRVAEQGENPADPVTVIDVPLPLFMAIAPAAADLPWLAHVRHADVTAKATDGDSPAASDYAVVLANRLPAPGTVSTAHLVSLEGLGPYLAGGGTAIPAQFAAVRVPTLASWSFGTESDEETFAGALQAVDAGPLQRRFVTTAAAGSEGARSAVQSAFGMGYLPFDHALRDGAATVSWYRGPLLPIAGGAPPAPPFADADQLLRYDPTSGMLDVSYSAAWTLGRLLALHDNAFATALYRWKLTQTHAAVAALEQQVLDDLLAGDSAINQVTRAVRALVTPALDSLG